MRPCFTGRCYMSNLDCITNIILFLCICTAECDACVTSAATAYSMFAGRVCCHILEHNSRAGRVLARALLLHGLRDAQPSPGIGVRMLVSRAGTCAHMQGSGQAVLCKHSALLHVHACVLCAYWAICLPVRLYCLGLQSCVILPQSMSCTAGRCLDLGGLCVYVCASDAE